jgi:hypothetical protein
MHSALLEFPGAQANRSLGEGRRMSAREGSIDILNRLEELRYDLQCIESAIAVVERLAFARFEKPSPGAGESALRKRANSKGKRKNQPIAFPRPLGDYPVASPQRDRRAD